MRVVTSHRSPNFTDLVIPVEFVVLHHTACSLERTLEIFQSKSSEASAHIVIDREGVVYELVPCLDGNPLRAWHAGRSRFVTALGGEQKIFEGFNDFSIGIELVNENGNLFPYSDAQYTALFALFDRLKALYPALQRPTAVVGHEHIAGFRGKVDPGRLFEWERFFSVAYPGQGSPAREPRCPELVAERLSSLVGYLGACAQQESLAAGTVAGESSAQSPSKALGAPSKALGARFFEHVSSLLESAMSDKE
jgi:N-acetylmuramoyl-L-alanine amidase